MFDGLFEWLGWNSFPEATVVADGYTGATPLALAAAGGWEAVTEVYSSSQMFWGAIPGSMGETCKPLILFGALMLIITKIASWRIMAGMVFGAALMALLLNLWGANPFMDVPWYYQFYMGSFWFAMAFMATDPVTASSTKQGKWIYGFLIGFVGMIIRVMNPAYPEGWMLSILLINTFSALIDNQFVNQNIKKRLARA
ncbi:MAG: RnfABCDGE type electron transport complex subunit D, partial [Bacteroidota bacterium]